jgi:transposase
MRGDDRQPDALFSYIRPEQRVPADHPLRPIRAMVDTVLHELSAEFARLYSRMGRPSIPPEKLLRALLIQVLYSIRSERQLIEQLDYNLLYRWFVSLSMDDPIWDVTVFTKNRERLIQGDIARAFFENSSSISRSAIRNAWPRRASSRRSGAPAIPTTTRSRRASSGCTRRR